MHRVLFFAAEDVVLVVSVDEIQGNGAELRNYTAIWEDEPRCFPLRMSVFELRRCCALVIKGAEFIVDAKLFKQLYYWLGRRICQVN